MSSLRLIDTADRSPATAWTTTVDRPAPTPVRMGSVLPGTSYRIVRWIGEGGMGVVYEAEHVDLQRRVALKILRPENSGDRRAADHFAAEARAVCQVASGYVVQVYDFARLPDGRAVFTMELLGHQTLLSERQSGTVTPARTIGLLRQVCKALAAAHDAGIIHRDVKPDNIAIIQVPGQRDVIKLLDFGIHAIVNAQDGTAEARPAGTPSYLAPEAIVGVPIGVGADVYSLGCAAYELLSGRLPFDQERDSERLLAHLDLEPPSLTEVAPHVPSALAAVVHRCLAKDPRDRWQDARDLEAALCEAQVAAGLQTDWDDLPLPDVDPDRRAALLRAMPDPIVDVARRRGRLAVFFGAALAMALLVILWPRTDPANRDAVHDLVEAARSAAARAYFVYPPPEQPDLPTAYRRVLELEATDAPGPERAAALREEFADTLARLGDRYWEEPGGMPFAIDYYAEAIVFVPEHARAAERAALTPGQLEAMRRKAATLEFSELELIAAEPLAALAEPDDAVRSRKLEALLKQPHHRAASIAANLDRLAANDGAGEPAPIDEPPRKPRRAPAPSDAPAAAPAEPAPPTAAKVSDSPATVAASPSTADPARLTQRAKAAINQGRYGEAQALLESALAHNPRNAAAHAGLALLYFDRGEYTAAAKRGRRAVTLAPKNATYRMRLGDAYYKSFRYREALEHYTAAKRLGHGDAGRAIGKVRAKLASVPAP